MIIRISYIVLLVVHCLTRCVGRDNSDSIKTYSLREVVVTATRTSLGVVNSPSRVYQISKQTIQESNGTSLGEILGVKSGLFTRSYGIGGSLQTLSFRGMSSEHTLILLNGVPINNVQTGLTDHRLIPLDDIEQVEIVRGGNSALYGGDAVGGVVNILTAQMFSAPYVRFEAGIGSFRMKRVAFSSHLKPESDLGITFGMSTEYGSGNYPFVFNQAGMGKEAVRANSDYRSQDFFVKSSWSSDTETHSDVALSLLTTERGTPGPLLTIANQGNARQADDQLNLVGSFERKFSEKTQFTAAGSFQNAYERYVDVGGLNPADNYYRNILWNFSPILRYSFSPEISISSGLELGEAIANGNALKERQNRSHTGIFVLSEFHTEGDSPIVKLSFYPSLRYDRYSSGSQAWSPKLGMNVQALIGNVGPFGNFRTILHSTVGKNFRVPTFNELYYAGAGGLGNSTLQPERSISFDIGISVNYVLFGKQDVDVTYFSISTEDRIIWQPASSPLIVSPKNIGKTLSTGIEIEFRWEEESGHVEFEGSYTLLDVRKKNRESLNDPAFDKQLPYVPLETGNIGLKIQVPLESNVISRLFGWIGDNYIGERYVAEGSNDILPAHHLFNGNLGLEFRLFGTSTRIKYEINNLSDISYEVMPRYPMPLRNQAISLSIMKSL